MKTTHRIRGDSLRPEDPMLAPLMEAARAYWAEARKIGAPLALVPAGADIQSWVMACTALLNVAELPMEQASSAVGALVGVTTASLDREDWNDFVNEVLAQVQTTLVDIAAKEDRGEDGVTRQ